ncbi:MAG: hypothetical protein ACRELY_31145, partial [Polyangiaceae bacterium]
TLSGAIAVETMREVDHPLVVAITEQIARDEARHTRLGWLYFEWAAEALTESERARLGEIARQEIEKLPAQWRSSASVLRDGLTSNGHRIQDVRELGWMESQHLVEVVSRCLREDIISPLAKLGIKVETIA